MANRYPLEHSYLISYHMLSPGHKALVNNLGRIVSARIDVNALFHHGVGSCTKSLARLVATWLNHRFLRRLRHLQDCMISKTFSFKSWKLLDGIFWSVAG